MPFQTQKIAPTHIGVEATLMFHFKHSNAEWKECTKIRQASTRVGQQETPRRLSPLHTDGRPCCIVAPHAPVQTALSQEEFYLMGMSSQKANNEARW